jgi:hypothetical protein
MLRVDHKDTYQNRVATNANHDDDHEHLNKEDPADSDDTHHTPPEHQTCVIARFRSSRGRIEDEDIAENEKDGGHGPACFGDPSWD